MMLFQTMLDIVSGGGNLVIDMNKQVVLSSSLVTLAQVASESGAHITIKNPHLLSSTMTELATIAGNSITFEL
jgi:hypothetical protein